MNKQKGFFLGLLPVLLVAVSLYLGGLGGCGGGGGGGGGGGDGGDSPSGTDLSDIDGQTSSTNAALSGIQSSLTGSMSAMSGLGGSGGALRLKGQEGGLPEDCTDDGTQTCCPAGEGGTCCVDNADVAAGNIAGTCTFTCAGGGTWTSTFTGTANSSTGEHTLDSCLLEGCGETVVCSGSLTDSFTFSEDGSASGSITTGTCGTGGLQCVSPDGETHAIDFTISFSGSAATGPSSFSGEFCHNGESQTFDDPREFYSNACAMGDDYGECAETCEAESAAVETGSGEMDCASQCGAGSDQFSSCMTDCAGADGNNCDAMADGDEKWDCLDGCFDQCDSESGQYVDCWNQCAQDSGCTEGSIDELEACVGENCSDVCSGQASYYGDCLGDCFGGGGTAEECSQVCGGGEDLWGSCFDDCMGMEGADPDACTATCDDAIAGNDEVMQCFEECFGSGGSEEQCVAECAPDEPAPEESCTLEQVDACKAIVAEAEPFVPGIITATDCIDAGTGMCAVDCAAADVPADCLALAAGNTNVTCEGSICTWIPGPGGP